MDSQNERILKMLRKGRSVTSARAKTMKVKNLRARICELRKKGYSFDVEYCDRFLGKHLQKYRVAKYRLKE